MFYRRHTVEKHYTCGYCDYAAAKKDTLKSQMERKHLFDYDELYDQLEEIRSHVQLAEEQEDDCAAESSVVAQQTSSVIDTKAIPITLSFKTIHGSANNAIKHPLPSCSCKYCGHHCMASQCKCVTQNNGAELSSYGSLQPNLQNKGPSVSSKKRTNEHTKKKNMDPWAASLKRALDYSSPEWEEPAPKRSKKVEKSEESEDQPPSEKDNAAKSKSLNIPQDHKRIRYIKGNTGETYCHDLRIIYR